MKSFFTCPDRPGHHRIKEEAQNTPNSRFPYQSALYGEHANRPLVLTTYQLIASISLDMQSPDVALGGLPGMVKY